MRPRAALADLRTLASPPLVRRGALIAAICLVERTITPALAWTLVQRTIRDKVVITILFGAVFTARGLVQRVFLARNEADLFERAAASVLAGDVLRADVLADEGVRLEVPHAVHLTSVLFSQTLANGLGDVVACAVLAVVVACLEPPRLVAVAAVLMIVAAAALLVSRRSVGNAVERAWKV